MCLHVLLSEQAVPFGGCFVNTHPLVAVMADVNYNCPDQSDGSKLEAAAFPISPNSESGGTAAFGVSWGQVPFSAPPLSGLVMLGQVVPSSGLHSRHLQKWG